MAIEPPHIPGLTDWRPLARGGFSVVWEARQESLDRLVAVKVDQRRLDVEAERLRFLREAGAAGRMSAHPGIVTVHDAGILADDRPYLVMDLCPGGSLSQYLKPGMRPSALRVREIGVRIADALAATHARGVQHRDVKPANILIDAYDNVGLADFGLAAMPGPGMASQETFRALTPAYTAPEILRRQPPTPYADVYSLAATLYALLAGRPPRWPESNSPTLVEVLRQQQRPVPPLPDADPGLMRVLMTALALEPAQRPTAAELRDQLAALELRAPVADGKDAVVARAEVGPPVGAAAATSTTGRSAGRRPLLASLLGLALVAVLISALIVAGRDPRPVAQPAPPVTTATAPTAPAGESSPPLESSPPASTPTESSSPSPSDSPSPAAVPAGYQDCTSELGQPSLCPTEDECWAGIISVFDSPAIGTPQDCDETHVYQTYAAADLPFEARKQSQLETDRQVRRLCSAKTLDTMLRGDDRDVDWEILALPPQQSDGDARRYRCIFGRGDRGTPVSLQQPR